MKVQFPVGQTVELHGRELHRLTRRPRLKSSCSFEPESIHLSFLSLQLN